MADRENAKTLPGVLEGKLGAGEQELESVGSLLHYYGDQEKLLYGYDEDLEGEAKPLYAACDQCHDCWPRNLRRPDEDWAGVAVPWIGPGYARSRACAVGINHNKWGGLGATWWITKCDIERRKGNDNCGGVKCKKRKLRFYALAARYLEAILNRRADFDPSASIEDAKVADLWNRVAYLQAVKCSPKRKTGLPTPTMIENCPERYLREEIRILDPSVLIVIGKVVWGSVAKALEVEAPADDKWAGRGFTDALPGRQLEVFFVVHPHALEYFPESVKQLADLR